MQFKQTRRSSRETPECCVETTMRGWEPKWLRCQQSSDGDLWHSCIALQAEAASAARLHITQHHTDRQTPVQQRLFQDNLAKLGIRKVEAIWILMKQETIGWQWHQLDHVQIICTLLHTDNHVSTWSLKFLQARCSSWHPNSVKALKVIIPFHTTINVKLAQHIWCKTCIKYWQQSVYTIPHITIEYNYYY